MTLSSGPAELALRIQTALRALASARAAESGQRFFKKPVELLGIRAADLHAVAREVFKTAGPAVTAPEAIDVCARLMAEPPGEIKIAGALFLSHFHRQLDPALFAAAKEWILAGQCESWAVIDALCIEVLGPVLVREPAWVKSTRPWRKSANLWLRRAAVVALVKPVRRGLLLDEAQEGMVPLLNDPEDLLQKAVGWLLRESGKPDLARLASFLDRHGRECARTTLRYAIERFPRDERERILVSSRGR